MVNLIIAGNKRYRNYTLSEWQTLLYGKNVNRPTLKLDLKCHTYKLLSFKY